MPPATPLHPLPVRSRLRAEVAVLVVVALVLGAVLVAVGVGVALAATPDGSGDHAVASSIPVAGYDDGSARLDAAQLRELTERLDGFGRTVRANRRAEADLAGFAAATELAAAAQAFDDARAQLGLPPDSYWDRMAYCETGGNWHMSGSRYSGGVGFANSTWNAFGGREFAANAGQATREQQIIVANRVATQGYGGVGAAGYSAWGCTARVGRP